MDCFYCQFSLRQYNHKGVYNHLSHCAKKDAKLLIPTFKFPNKEGRLVDAVFLESFHFKKAINKQYTKLRRKIKNFKLKKVNGKDPLFGRFPLSFKPPTSNCISVYQLETFSREKLFSFAKKNGISFPSSILF
eukprot:TRINITY_DN4675_c0_g1_i1.p1 TRINITY_DN4675_c0_g1~~TRINITY_DN4675_c0_g1_i1.p1  ORF type:complete len:133 (+),score=31.75 TRINITY_DN4675_c0_g1_i1:286-684(+)